MVMDRIKRGFAVLGVASLVAVGGTALTEVTQAPASEAALVLCKNQNGLVYRAGGGFVWIPGVNCFNTVTGKWEWKPNAGYGWA